MISSEECHAFHSALLNRLGGLGGIRDKGLLVSALDRPRNLFIYSKPTLFEIAACYAHGIIKNHPFIDGNKRCGFMAAVLFLEINELSFQASEVDVVERTFALAASAVTEAEYAVWLHTSCVTSY